METGKNGMSFALKLLKPALSLGGVVAGRLKVFSGVAKHRFGLDRFGQQTLMGVYRWLVLSLTAYLLAYWTYLHSPTGPLPDWGEAAQLALELLLPLMALLPLLVEIHRLQPLAKRHGLVINVTWCKM